MRQGITSKPGRERYARNFNALVQVGNVVDATPTRRLGDRIEIVPRQNPYALHIGQRLAVAVFFEGRPLAAHQLNAYNLAGNRFTSLTLHTDQRGRASFIIDRTGMWMVRLVHMRACSRDCAHVDWESFWTSLTFAVEQ